ncbi:MAG TPA: sigma 54-interacting transcriptional regulator [Blastocatellia bacterium]|nr:sigma 54-interacting transcriptional regulator [Blastocatellia bacterium]
MIKDNRKHNAKSSKQSNIRQFNLQRTNPAHETNSSPKTADTAHYVLSGNVEGVNQIYYLSQKRNLIGSHSSADVSLSGIGVSGIHAVISLQADKITLDDLGSEAGTFVNGKRAHSLELRKGDTLSFGSVRLKLGLLEREDLRLALVLERTAAREQRVNIAADTPAVEESGAAGGRRLIALVEQLVTEFINMSPLVLAGVLKLLTVEFGASAGAVGRWNGEGDASILATYGNMAPVTSRQEPYQYFGKIICQRNSFAHVATKVFKGDPSLFCGCIVRPDKELLGAVFLGEFEGPNHDHDKLLRIFIRLADRVDRNVVEPFKVASEIRTGTKRFPSGYISGESKKIKDLENEIELLAPRDFPVLILGETGVGKEHFAHMLHTWSHRRNKPYIAVNCAAIPGELLEAEMFGIGKGVATGVIGRQGKFQLAEEGTLFLDEIGEMSLNLQAKLLRVLETKEIQPVGGLPMKTNARIIAATNADLQTLIEQRGFRADLFYRLSGYILRSPPLREHKDDIALLAGYFLRLFADEMGKWIRGVSVKALEILHRYPWPGNIRELQHEMRRLVYNCPNNAAISSSMLSEHILDSTLIRSAPFDPDCSLLLEPRLREQERFLIDQALRRANNNRTAAAKLLGISRNGLAIKMKRLGLEV